MTRENGEAAVAFWPAPRDPEMSERRLKDRRKHARDYRVDVKRREFEQLRGMARSMAERIVRLEKDLADLRRKIRL